MQRIVILGGNGIVYGFEPWEVTEKSNSKTPKSANEGTLRKLFEYDFDPSGPKSEPYGISAINDIIWYSESGSTPNTVVRFDPKTEKFQSWAIPGGGNIVRNTSVTPDGNFLLANSLMNDVTLVTIKRD